MKPVVSIKDAPFPTTNYAASCCGAFSVTPSETINATDFTKEMEHVRFGTNTFLKPECSLGLMIMKNLLPPEHPMVKEILEDRPKEWWALPFKGKFFVFNRLERAKSLRKSPESPLHPMSYRFVINLTINEDIKSLISVTSVHSQDLKDFIKADPDKIFYAILSAVLEEQLDRGRSLRERAFAFAEAGFQAWPFTHRVHSGDPRRMIFFVYIPPSVEEEKEIK